MENTYKEELKKLTQQYFNIALSHLRNNPGLNNTLRKALSGIPLNEESELPGYETKPMKFGKFENREFVAMMTDIRASSEIINAPNGLTNMFLIFYIYAGIVAKIVDSYDGTSTEYLGDGVLNLFDTKEFGLNEALRRSALSSWDIFEALNTILNPFFIQQGLPTINLGIGIDHGVTIVTKFGYRNDTDLKAFGNCVYNVSKLCKGFNEILVFSNTQSIWPQSPTGNLQFGSPQVIDGKYAYPIYKSSVYYGQPV